MYEITCQICGCKKPLIPHRDRPDRKCPICNSLPRQRKLHKYLTDNNLPFGKTVLHVAPELCLMGFMLSRSDECIFIDKNSTRENILEMDMTDMHEFGSEKFDLVVCFHVLEHIKEDEKALDELARVTKKGGLLIICVPLGGRNNNEWSEEKIRSEKEKGLWGLPGRYDGHYRTYGIDDLKASLGRRFAQVETTSEKMTSEDFLVCKK